ncbi:MAG: glycosyltransferase family 1 protein [Paracoccaceae bacterium]
MRARLLDISRSVSRIGLGPATGIDRVERAYIRQFMRDVAPAFFLARLAGGFVLLDRAGMARFWPVLVGAALPGRPDLLAHLSRKLSPAQRRVQAELRRIAFARCWRRGLSRLLARHMPNGFAYVNVGHSNRSAPVWAAMRKAGAGPRLAMLHDTIPLDWPEFSREGLPERFAQELRSTAKGATGIICNSADTAARGAHWLGTFGLKAALHIAPLGCDALAGRRTAPVTTTPAEFVVLGTIEPRKNHALLLDVWDTLCAEPNAPQLHIIGRRGWRNDAVFTRLDAAIAAGQPVFEHGALDDTALAAHLARVRALLFPSFAEGFGYPLVEALQMGVPVLCSDLPVFRELAGPHATYLPADNPKAWLDAITAASHTPPTPPAKFDFPDWGRHFSLVDDLLA